MVLKKFVFAGKWVIFEVPIGVGQQDAFLGLRKATITFHSGVKMGNLHIWEGLRDPSKPFPGSDLIFRAIPIFCDPKCDLTLKNMHNERSILIQL